MSCYFMVDTYIDKNKKRCDYDEYIAKVKPIVEKFHGEYLIRTEKVQGLSENRKPQRVIIIKFPSRKELEECFSSDAYKAIMEKRINTVDSRAVIVEDR